MQYRVCIWVYKGNIHDIVVCVVVGRCSLYTRCNYKYIYIVIRIGIIS